MSREIENDVLKSFIRLPMQLFLYLIINKYKLLYTLKTIGKLFILIIINPEIDDHLS